MRKNALVVVATFVACVVLTAQAPDRTKPPQPGPPAALRLPAIQKQKLSNGLPVWVVELHKVPVAQVNLVSFSGTANDPPGKYGLARVLYGKAHRYGTPQMGTAETIKTFTVDDLRGFYASMFRPDNATLLAVGDLSADKIVPLLEKQYGGWKASGAAAAEKLPPVEP